MDEEGKTIRSAVKHGNTTDEASDIDWALSDKSTMASNVFPPHRLSRYPIFSTRR